MSFKLISNFKPAGGQPDAIAKLTEGLKKYSKQTLLGITGSGKTFCMANVIKNYGRPTLVLAHNKTLAAQLYQELKELFPENRVEYFISYYDYYQPESYLPATDTYIEKDSSVNEQIEKMRLKATSSLMARNDVIVVASISCIYGLGNPDDFKSLSINLKVGDKLKRQDFIIQLIHMQYTRSDQILETGKFRVRGDVIDVFPSYDDTVLRVELFGDEIDRISEINPITGVEISKLKEIKLFPGKQFVVPEEKTKRAVDQIRQELHAVLPTMKDLEAQRLERRVKYDLEMIDEVGYCSGIENYSRHFDGRAPGEKPYTLLDYFPEDFLLIIDESHQSVPQSRAMYNGDYARKKALVDYGFRLPCAFDNRPLKFEEFEKYFRHTIFVSATPAEYELTKSKQVVELIIRPTGLIDPVVEVKPIKNQIADLVENIRETVKRKERVLVTTLTKKMSEDLTDFLAGQNVKVRYLHSEIGSLERIELIRALRAGEFDVLVGINLLREGLDLPEVSFIAILDADKEGFLRDERSLIQTIGRAARNVNGRVTLYADVMTKSITKALQVTNYRREQQIKYNKEHGITPKTVFKSIAEKKTDVKGIKHMPKADVQKKLIELDAEMKKAAESLDFERAIALRDTIAQINKEVNFKEKYKDKK